MNKPVIAIDIDDVLANSAEAVRLAANEHLGMNLERSHYQMAAEYWHYYESVWESHGLQGRISLDDIEDRIRSERSGMLPNDNARAVLEALSDRYTLVVVTARSEERRENTLAWLEEHFGDLFTAVIFAGGHEGIKRKSKGVICREQGASWLIDDSVEHAHSALENDVRVILFGEYGWHKPYQINDEVVRCIDWLAVQEFFDGQR
jgi:5'(3')-deoxyribonucleotidase